MTNPSLAGQSTFRLTKLVVVMGALLLTGCAVTPEPLSGALTPQDLAAERSAMYQNQEPLTGPLTLDEALARAVKYNLEHRVKLLEEAVARDQLDVANFGLLPKLTAAAGYTSRDNELGSSSQDLATGAQSLVPSTSTDRSRGTADLTLSWNLLDFGVSYYQAKQQADRVLAAQERRRKVVQQLMLQVRRAYWQAAGAQALQDSIKPILEQADAALKDSRKIESERLRSPLESLTYQRQLLDLVTQLEDIQTELSQAQPRLAALINLEPGKSFQLAVPTELRAPVVNLPLEKMEEVALQRRPDLMEARYNERIGVNETRRAMASLFPGLEFSIGAHRDNNSFLVNNSWRDAGVRVSWNLFNLLSAGSIRRAADNQLAVAREQHLALNMAVLSQVHIAYREFLGRQRQFELSTTLNRVDQDVLKHTRNAAQSSAQGKLQEIRASASAAMSTLRLYDRYSNLQSAYGQVLATLGLDPLPDEMRSHDLAAVKEGIRSMEATWVRNLQ
jgi:outer membrane protein TolC